MFLTTTDIFLSTFFHSCILTSLYDRTFTHTHTNTHTHGLILNSLKQNINLIVCFDRFTIQGEIFQIKVVALNDIHIIFYV